MRDLGIHLAMIFGSGGIGFLLGLIVVIPGVTWDSKLNPLHAMSILVTFVVAAFFGVILARNDRKSTSGKALTIERLGKIDSTLNSYETLVLDDHMTYQLASTFRKRVYGALKCIWDEAKIEGRQDQPDFKTFDRQIAKVHRSLTWSPRAAVEGGVSGDMTVNDNKICFGPKRTALIIADISKLRNELYSLQHAVNRM